jgi:Ca2+-binding RTX toxin-like protein
LAEIAGSQFGARFAAATFVAFASPVVTEASHILNLGFENDPIFKALNGYADFVSSTDNLVVATAEYMAGNYDGQHPFDDYAHDVALSFAALSGLARSRFYPLMSPDSVVIFDANLGLVQDITPGREATGAFYLGQDVSDVITGRAGNDFIEGFGGNDTVRGGPGNDNLDGGVGTDTALYTGVSTDFSWHQSDGTWTVTDLRSGNADGTDTLFDIETLSFSDKAVELIATVPGTVFTGDSEDNVFVGGAGEDTITGNGGNDVLLGGGGADYISSGDGNDKAFGEAGNDTVIGGNGDDYLNGGADDDLIVGNDGADTLLGDTGNDYLDGGTGDDLVMGGAGNDTVLGAGGNDYVNGEGGNDLVFGGDGLDTLLGADGNDYLNGENGNDIIFGDAGNDTVIGGEGNDYLSAGDGDDNLVGGNGNDTLFAGSGSDYLKGDAGDDRFVFDATFQTSLVIDFTPGAGPVGHDVIQFATATFANFADAMAHAVQDGTNTVFTDAGGHTLTLANVLKTSLVADDFTFA